MEIQNKWNNFVNNLSKPTFKINLIIFAILWMVGNFIGFYLSILVILLWVGDQSGPFLVLPCLFYLIICMYGLIHVGRYFFKTKRRWVQFPSNMFIVCILWPQSLFGFYCLTRLLLSENRSSLWLRLIVTGASIILPLICLFSYIFYINGVRMFFRKVFNINTNAIEIESSVQDWQSFLYFLLPVIPIILVMGSAIFPLAQGYNNAVLDVIHYTIDRCRQFIIHPQRYY
ncbi:MAG: hypothetical protein WAW33_00180 [Minisyncoccia bacterium]